MKTALVLLVFAAVAFNGALAQTALTLSNPAVQSFEAPAMSLDTPALPTATPTNAELTAPTAESLPGMLLNLQTQVENLLPVLEQLNEGIEANAGTIITSGGNFGMNLGSNFSANFATSFGANVSVPTRGVPSSVLAAGTGQGVRDTFRALLVLQNDLERVLPNLLALNGATNQPTLGGLTPGFVPAPFTNVFTTSPSAP